MSLSTDFFLYAFIFSILYGVESMFSKNDTPMFISMSLNLLILSLFIKYKYQLGNATSIVLLLINIIFIISVIKVKVLRNDKKTLMTNMIVILLFIVLFVAGLLAREYKAPSYVIFLFAAIAFFTGIFIFRHKIKKGLD